MPQHPLPTHLQHEPVFALPYFDIDGPFAKNTDAQFLTVGIGQWNHKDLSAKVMRWSSGAERWIRSSEELPVHRALDLAKMIAMASQYRHGATMPFPGSEAAVDIVGQAQAVEVAERLRTDPHVQSRLNELADCLRALGYGS